MRKYLKYIILAVLSTLLLLSGGCSKKDNVAGTPSDTAAAAETAVTNAASEDETEDGAALDEGGSYTSKEDVALYIYTYGKLPENFITKKRRKNSDGMAVHWSLMLRAWQLAATDSEIMKACFRKKTA